MHRQKEILTWDGKYKAHFPPAVPLAQWVYSPSLKNARGCENDGALFQVFYELVKLGLGLSTVHVFEDLLDTRTVHSIQFSLVV